MPTIDRESGISIETVKKWCEHWMQQEADRATEGGKYPHRAGGTVTAMRCDSIQQICELAIYAIRVKRSVGKKANAVAAEELRQLADELSKAT